MGCCTSVIGPYGVLTRRSGTAMLQRFILCFLLCVMLWGCTYFWPYGVFNVESLEDLDDAEGP